MAAAGHPHKRCRLSVSVLFWPCTLCASLVAALCALRPAHGGTFVVSHTEGSLWRPQNTLIARLASNSEQSDGPGDEILVKILTPEGQTIRIFASEVVLPGVE